MSTYELRSFDVPDGDSTLRVHAACSPGFPSPTGTPRVVLLHGSGLSHVAFLRVGGRLTRRGIAWFAPDFAGSGETAAASPAVDRAIARRALAEAGEGGAWVAGHSYGGARALGLALERPAGLNGLILFEPAVVHVLRDTGDVNWPSVVALLDTGLGDRRAFNADPEAWLRAFVDFWSAPGDYDRMPPAERGRFLATAGTVFAEVHALMEDTVSAADYATLDVSASVWDGDRSPPAAHAICQRLRAVLRSTDAQRLPGGHMTPFTHPDAFCDALAARLLPQAPSGAPPSA
ncbi:MAG: alpha/beta hydrolase [Myxococcales bacterium]|nr:alpha/beta hydrolase [Myxococcales bacterium]